MGDVTSSPSSATPGIMLVRPSLHHADPSNASTFRRWTIMHFNDLLNCQAPPNTKGITRALRYSNPDGQLLYTIHADDISIWQTQPYYAVSRRLDLENTRDVREGETAVLQGDHGFKSEPMVWDAVDASFGIFEEHVVASSGESGGGGKYQELPGALLSPQGCAPGAPECALVTLTCNVLATGGSGEERNRFTPPKELVHLRDQVLGVLSAAGKTVYSSLYRHRPDAQPDMHPRIAEGADGNGAWVICIFAEGEVGEKVQLQFQDGLEGVRIGVWKGEVFMC